MLRKLLPLFILVILIGVATTPYFVGKKFETQYQQSIAEINKFYAGQFTVKGTFTHGFFKSTAITEITIAKATEPLVFKHTIYNGPVILEFDGVGNLRSYMPKGFKLATVSTTIESANLNNAINTVYKGKPAYTIISDFAFDGSGVTTVTNFPFSFNMGAGEVNWKGMSLTIKHTKNFMDINAALSMPELSYAEMTADMAKKNEFRVSDVKVNYSSGAQLPAENMDFSVASISITEGSVSVFNADKVEIKGDYAKANKLINSDVTYSFNNIAVGADAYGPMLLTVKFSNLNVEVFDVLTAKLAADRAVAMANSSPRELLHRMHSYLTDDQFRMLLTAMPAADIELTLTTPKGKLAYKSKFTIGAKDLQHIDFATVLATVDSDTSFTIDQALLYTILSHYAEGEINQKAQIFAATNKTPNVANPYAMTPQQMQPVIEKWLITLLDKLEDKKYLIENDKQISSDLKITKGVVQINTKDFHHKDLEDIKALFNITIAPKVIPVVKPVVVAPAPAVVPGTNTTVVPSATPNPSSSTPPAAQPPAAPDENPKN